VPSGFRQAAESCRLAATQLIALSLELLRDAARMNHLLV